jgi:sec-independent protein translocase protein TatA
MFGLGYQELLLILLILVVLFGASRIPELARSLGTSIREFKKGAAEVKEEVNSATSAAKKEEEKKA